MLDNLAFAPHQSLIAISTWRQATSVALAAASSTALLSLWLPFTSALTGGCLVALILGGQWILARIEGDQQRILQSSQWSLFGTLIICLACIWVFGPLAALCAALCLAPGWAWFASERAFALQLASSSSALFIALLLGQDATSALLCLIYLPGLWLCLMSAQVIEQPVPAPTTGKKNSKVALKQHLNTLKYRQLLRLSLITAPLGLMLATLIFFLLSPRLQGTGWLPLHSTETLSSVDGLPAAAADAQSSLDQLQQRWLLANSPTSAAQSPLAFPAFGERFALDQLPEHADGPVIGRVKSPLGINLQVSRFDLFDGTQWINTAQDRHTIAVPEQGMELGREDRFNLVIKWLAPMGHTLAVPGGWQYLHLPSTTLTLGAQSLSLPQTMPPGFSYRVKTHGLSLDGHPIAQVIGVLHPNYLQVPETLRQPLQAWLVANLPQLSDPWQRARWLEHHLQSTYSADRHGVAPSYQRDPILFYLHEQRGGRSETAASALTLLLRSLGIYARLSCGWALDRRDPFTGLFELSAVQAHCYSEAFINNQGWVELEPSALYSDRPAPRKLTLGAALVFDSIHGQPTALAALLAALCGLSLLALIAWGGWRLWPLVWEHPKVLQWRLKKLAATTLSRDDPAGHSLEILINGCRLIGYQFPAGAGIRPWACLWQTLVPSFDAEAYCQDFNCHHFGLNTQADITAAHQTLIKTFSALPWPELTRWVKTQD